MNSNQQWRKIMSDAKKIPPRVANVLLNALKGGVVPRYGLPYIQVGRKDEIEALLRDIEVISEGGASFRIIVGKYGDGKSFLLQLIRTYAMDKGFVVVDADLSPERRLIGSRGEGLATYRELIKNMSTKTSSDNALSLLLQKWIEALKIEVMSKNNLSAESQGLNRLVEQKIYQTVHELEAIVHGFDFAKVISMYWQATVNEDDDLKSKALKWLRGEFTTKTEAKQQLGVGSIISDDNWYDYIKLLSMFVVKAGYKGMIIIIDELVNLYRLPSSVTRQKNYEKLLTIYNDTMQGKAQHLGVLMGGTPQSIDDTHRGVYSYEALKSRLMPSRFSDSTTRDLLSPVIRLQTLTPEEMLFLVHKLVSIHAFVYKYEPKVQEKSLEFFIKTEFARIGAKHNITPREIIRDFIELLNIIYQNPDKTLESILGSDTFKYAESAENDETIHEEFKGFKI